MNQILKINCISIRSLYFFALLFLVNSATAVFAQDYKELSLKELEELEGQIIKELSYCKFEYYLKKIENGKSRYSLASISDKKLKSIMENAPKDEVFRKKWKDAVIMSNIKLLQMLLATGSFPILDWRIQPFSERN